LRTAPAIALLLLVAPAAGPVQAEPRVGSFRVVVNPGNPLTAVERQFVLDAFLKRATRWENGDALHPVDLIADSPVRRRFSQDVLGRPVSAIQSYWQQAIFSGRDVPPPELDTDEAVIQYVLKYRGAVGYVSETADTHAVKIVTVK